MSGKVAPRAGAWIETSVSSSMMTTIESLPVRGRGLKLKLDEIQEDEGESLPVRGRGLKLQ